VLYFARALDSTLPTAMSDISTEQAYITIKSMAKVKQLLDYCTNNAETTVHFHCSAMYLSIESNASYLCMHVFCQTAFFCLHALSETSDGIQFDCKQDD
jgi:hypothetical protein